MNNNLNKLRHSIIKNYDKFQYVNFTISNLLEAKFQPTIENLIDNYEYLQNIIEQNLEILSPYVPTNIAKTGKDIAKMQLEIYKRKEKSINEILEDLISTESFQSRYIPASDIPNFPQCSEIIEYLLERQYLLAKKIIDTSTTIRFMIEASSSKDDIIADKVYNAYIQTLFQKEVCQTDKANFIRINQTLKEKTARQSSNCKDTTYETISFGD